MYLVPLKLRRYCQSVQSFSAISFISVVGSSNDNLETPDALIVNMYKAFNSGITNILCKHSTINLETTTCKVLCNYCNALLHPICDSSQLL